MAVVRYDEQDVKGVISLICAVRERTVRCKEGNTAAVARLELVIHVIAGGTQ